MYIQTSVSLRQNGGAAIDNFQFLLSLKIPLLIIDKFFSFPVSLQLAPFPFLLEAKSKNNPPLTDPDPPLADLEFNCFQIPTSQWQISPPRRIKCPRRGFNHTQCLYTAPLLLQVPSLLPSWV